MSGVQVSDVLYLNGIVEEVCMCDETAAGETPGIAVKFCVP